MWTRIRVLSAWHPTHGIWYFLFPPAVSRFVFVFVFRCFFFFSSFLSPFFARLGTANTPAVLLGPGIDARHDESGVGSVQCNADGPGPAYRTKLMNGDDGIQGDKVERERDSALHEPEVGMGMVRWWNQPGRGPARRRCRPRLDLGWAGLRSCRFVLLHAPEYLSIPISMVH
ncbi:uncharacterized protein LY79DRAFT_86922 [Colletotrichum navitas]|uniref:Uncharacterized protein n=1 Tax=Colletotrichum navitas TaxID=681940 RepID=A0AAD8PKI6_9PEZI|nr:uncharacterized protein LY79DRAFT_86922 [Colletotrichum navitas]KAK1569411.1 hypothetical protein LY79DRAFT_86922 [Colletotrichum navitas]